MMVDITENYIAMHIINMSEYAVEYFKSMCEKYSDQTKIPENLLKTNIEHQEYQWDDLEERASRISMG